MSPELFIGLGLSGVLIVLLGSKPEKSEGVKPPVATATMVSSPSDKEDIWIIRTTKK